MKNRVYESMTKVTTGYFAVRVWRTEGCLVPEDNSDIVQTIEGLWPNPFMSDIVHAIEKLPRIAAIEVTDRLGNGVLLYPDWS